MPIILQPTGTTPIATVALKVAPHMRDCPEFTVREAIRQAAIDFCRDSACLRSEKIELVSVTGSGASEFTLPAVANVTYNALHFAWSDGEPIDIIQPGDEAFQSPEETESEKYGVRLYRPNILKCSPVPVPGKTIWGIVSYEPQDTATVLDAQLVSRWGNAIEARAKVLLYKMADKPWGRLDLVDFFQRQYREDVGLASHDAGPINRRLRVQVV